MVFHPTVNMPIDLKAVANNPNFDDKELLADICTMFEGHNEASEFILLYGAYIEPIDDLVDEEKDVKNVRLVGELAARLFNCTYWKKWGNCLYLVERLIHNTYFDSVVWESADEEWKRRDAKCLSHAGYNMLFAVVLLEFGEDALKGLSLRFREHAHKRHLGDKI